MRKITLLLLLIATFTHGQSVFINEIHYDNAGGDVNEGVEIAGPALTDLSTYSIVLYNGSSSSLSVYKTENLSGVITDMQNGFGVINFPISSIQNGGPDGIALVEGSTVIQFLSYEGSFTAADGPATGMTSVDIGVSETASTPEGESLQLTGTGTVYTDYIWNAPSVASRGTINVGQTFGSVGSDPSLTITSPTNNNEFNPGTTTVDVTFTTQNFDLTGGNFVEYIINTDTPQTTTNNSISVSTVDGGMYTVTLELKNAGGSLSPVVTKTVEFSVLSYTNVSDIATLRSLDVGDYAALTNEAILTFQQDSRNQKYIQDTTGAILIDDASGVITTPYTIADGITGIKGQVGEFGGILQFIPTEDPGVATSTANMITPQVVTFAELSSNFENYESEVIQVIGVTYTGLTEGQVYEEATNYTINDGVDDLIVRTFSDATIDYVGQSIPTNFIDVTGIAGEFNGASQILPRNLADIVTSISSTPSLNITSPSNNEEFLPGTIEVDVTFVTQNFDLTGDNFVEYVVNTNNAQTTTNNVITIATVEAGMYTVTLELKNAGGSLSPVVVKTVEFSILPTTNVSNIAALRALNEGDYATLTNEAIVTFQQDSRNQKYIQDASGAILIDDNAGVITTTYAIGDGITGMIGQIGGYGGVIQFIPTVDPGAATSTVNTITPQVVTIDELSSNFENYESEVIQVQGVTFTGLTEGQVYVEGTNYTINDGTADLLFRTFADATIDYVGQTIPIDLIDVVGIAGEFNGAFQVLPRSLADISSSTLSVSDFNDTTNSFNVFPNPIQDGFISFRGITTEMEIKIFNVLGSKVLDGKVENTRIDVSDLTSGIYIIQLYKDTINIATKRILIK